MKLAPVSDLNRAIQHNRIDDVTRALGREPGMRALEFSSGVSRWEWMPTDDRARSPFGFLHGGYLAVFADVLLSSAIGTVLTEGELATTAELKVSFVRPAKFERLLGEGRVVRKGSRVAFVDAAIRDVRGELLASATSTWTVVGAGAQNRAG